ncbi:MAG TPA: hypothetical protein VJR24_11825 [Gemmatimonadaceae bacterium]|nr:hypothetical protein [Gemmatimonadaceae bacterium]
MRRTSLVVGAVVALAACSTSDRVTGNNFNLTPPSNLTYQLIPSGNADAPEGIDLRWDPVNDPNISDYAVFSRASTSDQWSLRAQTTSPSFEDLGQPDLQYYVASEAADGSMSAPSNVITVDNTNKLPPPQDLSAIALDMAVELSWAPNARLADPAAFSYYRVYSTVYHASQNLCDTQWVLEGTTVSEDFIASGLPNGQPRCFDVSAISIDGHESDWPTPIAIAPSATAGDVVVFSSQDSLAKSGFTLGASMNTRDMTASGARTDIDFRVDRHADGSMWIVPVKPGTSVALYSTQPISNLSAMGVAPTSGFTSGAVQAKAKLGYVIQTARSDGMHYARVRVAAVGHDYIIFEWSYQQSPGDPVFNRVAVGGGAIAR